MELIITEITTPTICLNMIVKDESHIIKETLDMLCKKINFSYWVICDTGSTDNTRQIIQDFFEEKNIPGELHTCKWINFAANRTLALKLAKDKTDLLFIFDADDEIHGELVIPNNDKCDGYYLSFGSSAGISYKRVLLINNRINWKYESVIHEYITCLEPKHVLKDLPGNYYVVSGRRGSRNKDPNKYLKDAEILRDEYYKAKQNNDPLYLRYGFYCANSYKDYGNYSEAINWYKIVLSNENWHQEKYMSCLQIYNCSKILNNEEDGIYYLVEAFKYDPNRLECVGYLVQYYCTRNEYKLAYLYYKYVQSYYENIFLNDYNSTNKLFVESDKSNFILPYYMIIVADKVKSEFTEATTTIYKMFEIIFIKKYPIINYFFTDNLLYNLQFFIENCMKQSENFINLFQTYIDYLQDAGYDVYKHNFISSFEKYGLVLKKIKKSLFSNEECMKSNKILFYTGYANLPWNYTFSVSNALGGSETAVANLSRYFPKYYEIYVAGQVQEERIDNISYINLNTLQNIVKTTPFHTVIVSRYIAFYEIFQEASYYQSFIWGHDVHLINYGCGLDSNSILGKWKNKINGCICQTEWHKNLFSERYPEINDKLFIINNGILVDKFTCKPMKNANRFIYTSCSERGLDRVIELWPEITDLFPDAELYICSYNPFPSNEFERTTLQNNMKKYESIKHLGCLNKDELYKLMSTAEYWFYPTNWPETSCITAMEMLMSEVICVYYPIAGLVDTLGDFGIKVDKGNEIKVFEELTSKKKSEIKKKGKEYALSCSWENRSSLWMQSIFNSYNKDITYNIDIEKRIRNLYEGPCMIPKVHIDFLKKLRDEENFQPKVIYDIGANVLHWTREAKNIWQNSEIIVFDAIKTGEFLYKEQNLKYHIGVLSDEDNKTVKFYENLEHPAGNSYYQEIGHPKSSEIYPDNCFTVQNAMTLSSVVKMNKFSYPDLIKIDVQGAELDIMKGSLDVINKSKYLIVELQNTQYNKQAPLCDETISFLNENGWDLYAEKFSDNGPDADYCFVNRKYEKWVVFVDEYTVICLEDYINSLKTEYNIEFTKDKNYILNSNFDHISFLGIYLSNNKNRIDLYDKIRNNNIKISIINTEPLNIKCRIYELTTCYNELTAEFNKDITIYDYSLSNISILNGTNIYNTQHLNYIVYDNENKFLTNIYKNNTKRFDFGIVSYDNPISCERRQKVVNYLRNNGYTVNIITGWGNKRDEELSTCNVILNIHGFWIEPTAIFEHIRCDRLLSAGFKILSEESINLDINFINKYPNLKIIKYDNFFDLKTYL